MRTAYFFTQPAGHFIILTANRPESKWEPPQTPVMVTMLPSGIPTGAVAAHRIPMTARSISAATMMFEVLSIFLAKVVQMAESLIMNSMSARMVPAGVLL